jgi:uncharacterized protein (DUF111 family)
MNIWIDCTQGMTAAKFLDALTQAAPDTRSLDEVHCYVASDYARKRARDVFDVLAQAEAHAHGASLEAVHFHEVGSLENMAHVVGVFATLDMLGVDAWYASPPVVGNGTVVCSHGVLAIPAPATAYLIEQYGIPVTPLSDDCLIGELTTPTGAALLTQADGFSAKPPDNALVLRTRILP